MKNNLPASGESALSTALQALSRRQLTVFQLQKRLQDKGFSPEAIAEAVSRLTEWKYLDDQGYARAYINSKKEKYSPKRIKIELLKAGIDEDTASGLLADYYPEKQEYENCKILAEKFWNDEDAKWERKHRHDPQDMYSIKEAMIRKKVGDRLLKRGFLFSTVRAVLNRIEREDF
ncbi:MAG: regulatory protein RecX [Desulfitobacteriia bacterium]